MLWPLLCSFVFCFVCAVCIFRLHASLRSGTERFGLSEAALSGSVAECRRLRLVPAPQSLAKRRGAPAITPKSALKALLWSAAAPQSLAKRRGAPAITPKSALKALLWDSAADRCTSKLTENYATRMRYPTQEQRTWTDAANTSQEPGTNFCRTCLVGIPIPSTS